jgi:hypothetical protein
VYYCPKDTATSSRADVKTIDIIVKKAIAFPTHTSNGFDISVLIQILDYLEDKLVWGVQQKDHCCRKIMW